MALQLTMLNNRPRTANTQAETRKGAAGAAGISSIEIDKSTRF